MSATSVVWSHAPADVQVEDIRTFTSSINWSCAIDLIQRVAESKRILFSLRIRESISAHLMTESNELGGLLFGRVYSIAENGEPNYSFITIIDGYIASREYDNSSVSLRMGTEVWRRADEFFAAGKMVVGWYHSHPDLGAFFSGVDRATQKAFFQEPYCIGLVIDPIRREEKLFTGRDSTPLTTNCVIYY